MKQMETKEEESIGEFSTPLKAGWGGNKVIHRWSKTAERNKVDGCSNQSTVCQIF